MNTIIKIQEPNPTSLNSRNKNNGVLLVGFLILGHTKVVVSHCLVLHLKRGSRLFYMFQMDCFKRHHLYPTIYIYIWNSLFHFNINIICKTIISWHDFLLIGSFPEIQFHRLSNIVWGVDLYPSNATVRLVLVLHVIKGQRDGSWLMGFFRSDGSLERFFSPRRRFLDGLGTYTHGSDLSWLVKYSLCPVQQLWFPMQPLWALLWATWRTESPQKSNSTQPMKRCI